MTSLREPRDVVEEISPKDTFWYGKWDNYLRFGYSALSCVRLALLTARRDDPSSLIDFGSGYGRILRVFKAAFPQARLAACDIDHDAVDFCAKALGAKPVYSYEQPERIDAGERFDLVWAGSVLTHLPGERWSAFLELFQSMLEPGGVLVFTTAGRTVAEKMRAGEHLGLSQDQVRRLLDDYGRTGFGYHDYPDWPGYGLARSTPEWVCRRLERHPGLRLVCFTERGWGERQDVVACVKEGS